MSCPQHIVHEGPSSTSVMEKEGGKEDEEAREDDEEEEGDFVPDVTVIPSLSLAQPFVSACGYPAFTNYVQVGREGGWEGGRAGL